MSKKVLFIDAFGTLLKGSIEAIADTCKEIVENNSLSMTPKEFLIVWDRHYKELLGGEFITLWRANEVSLKMTYEELGIEDETDSYLNEMYKSWYSVTPYDDVKEVFPKLSSITKCMLSNADDHLLDVALKKNDLHFEYYVSSERVRAYKPYPKIFQFALDEVGCRPDEVVHVGDSQTSDIVGAKRAGIPVIWINRYEEELMDGIPTPDYEVQSLHGMLEIVSREEHFSLW
ncbi:MAG: HAD family hydrolase [Methanomassiliicoccales archaeon]|nr:MAG: HAD family hydrolase [Methanomassiliicoccales archaeon]